MSIKNITTYFFLCLSVLMMGCTKLDERFRGDLTDQQIGADAANTSALLRGVYTSMMSPFTSRQVVFPLQEFSSDEMIAPIRGNEWGDNNLWRVFHLQNWTSYSPKITECFNTVNGISYAATDLLRYQPKKQEAAEARFIRAFMMYLLLEMFNQVPYRDPGESLVQASRVRIGTDALDYIISELDTIKNDLPLGPAYLANQYAAKFLLMKCYLNKAVFINRLNPSFDKADMDKVISLADNIIQSEAFTLSDNYFDNFAPDNTEKKHENIFTLNCDGDNTPNNLSYFAWIISLHYNQYPAYQFSGANGFTSLSDFYDKFEASDIRRGTVYRINGLPINMGNHVNVGFLVGQQYNLNNPINLNDSLFDLDPIPPVPLFYTREVHNIEGGPSKRLSGIRGLKYYPDFQNYYSATNDFVFFRFPDVLLMKAEAILRQGTPTPGGIYGSNATEIVNYIRTHPSRNASKLSSVDLNTLLDERGREFWWEGWRREDMIRFKKFLLPVQERAYESDPKYLLYPIPAEQLAVNPNLLQNPGY